MKLLLTSSGFATPTLEKTYRELCGGKKLRALFVPTAADPEQDKSFVHSAREELERVSSEVIDFDLKEKTEIQVSAALNSCDVLFINGGNTFYLLDHAYRCGLIDLAKTFVARGGIYVGASAGSILASPTIEVAGWKGFDDPKIVTPPSLNALGFVPFHLFVHYAPQWDDLIARETPALSGELIKLRDGDAVVVDGDRCEVVKS